MRQILLTGVAIAFCLPALGTDGAWKRHTIDDSSRGADGVRLGDADGDGRLDIVTGWEEGGRIRICFGPSLEHITKPWPSIEVGAVKSPEDAVFADVNDDGWPDVISCCEGRQQSINIHLNPGDNNTRESAKWRTTTVKASVGMTRWMFCEPHSSGKLIVGSKEPGGRIAEFEPDLAGAMAFKVLRKSGWIMSLQSVDVDRDGDQDIVYSDRKGDHRGVGWLEYQQDGSWSDHVIGGHDMEIMFLDVSTVSDRRNGAGEIEMLEVFCDTRNGRLLRFRPGTDIRKPWNVTSIAHPDSIGGGKGVAVGDLNNDGHHDLACTCEHAEGKIGVYWIAGPFENGVNGDASVATASQKSPAWFDISGTEEGVKFDRIELLDIDDDGDLDLLTCEERDNLGVVWYENPFQPEKN